LAVPVHSGHGSAPLRGNMKRNVGFGLLVLLALFTGSGDAQTSRGTLVECVLTTTATTSTLITGCEAPPAGFAIYITDISVYGDIVTATATPATIQSGTGATCGTGTKVHYVCQHPAVSGCEAHYQTPARAVPEGNVCILDGTTGSKYVTIKGYIAAK
jgi:hypothetical protein